MRIYGDWQRLSAYYRYRHCSQTLIETRVFACADLSVNLIKKHLLTSFNTEELCVGGVIIEDREIRDQNWRLKRRTGNCRTWKYRTKSARVENAGPQNAGWRSLRKWNWKRKNILSIIVLYFVLLAELFIMSLLYLPSHSTCCDLNCCWKSINEYYIAAVSQPKIIKFNGSQY